MLLRYLSPEVVFLGITALKLLGPTVIDVQDVKLCMVHVRSQKTQYVSIAFFAIDHVLLLLQARFLAYNSPKTVWWPGSARARWRILSAPQTSRSCIGDLWPKFEILTVSRAVFPHFWADKREIWRGGACQISCYRGNVSLHFWTTE